MKKYILVLLIISQVHNLSSQNNYGFDFVGKDLISLKKNLSNNNFWEFNGEVDQTNHKEVLIIRRGKSKLFDGYGTIRLRKNKVYEFVFYISKNYEKILREALKPYNLLSKNKWKSNIGTYICFIEDEDLIEAKEIGFSLGLQLCDGKQKD